jgi:hypothetical protein
VAPGIREKRVPGHLGSHHAVACPRILGHLDLLGESIASLTEQVDVRTAAFAPSTRRYCRRPVSTDCRST